MPENEIQHSAPVPPFVTFVTSAVPMVFDNSMSYYEALCALWKWLQDDVIDVINNNANVTNNYIDLTNEYIEKFNELKSYVDNYFDNLDVQEEINNKLDAMVEDGTLQELINNYLQPNVTWTFDTVADMAASTNLVEGGYARTLGFHEVNDGGGALYKIVNTGTANGMNIIAVGSLFANIVYNNEINVKQFGAYGDGTHDDTSAIAQAISIGLPVYIPDGHYKVTSSITIANKIVHGAGQFKTFIEPTDDISDYAIIIGSDHVKLHDFTIQSDDYEYEVVGTDNTKTAIYINDYHHLTFSNVRVLGFNYGIYARRAWCMTLTDVMALCCNHGVYGIDEFNNILMTRCILINDTIGLFIQGGFGIELNACDIEKNETGVWMLNRTDINFVSCYFENNTSCATKIEWGNTYVRSVTFDSCTFWANASCDGLIKYHTHPDMYIVCRSCTFRNNDVISPGSIPIFIKDSSTQCLPHLIGCKIGASFSVIEDAYIDYLKPVLLTQSDWITPSTGVEINDFCVYEDNKHIFGTLTFTVTGGVPSASSTLGVLKDKYKPQTAVNTYAALSSDRWQQTTSNLCYLYISSTSIATRNGDGTSTVIKANIDYVRK